MVGAAACPTVLVESNNHMMMFPIAIATLVLETNNTMMSCVLRRHSKASLCLRSPGYGSPWLHRLFSSKTNSDDTEEDAKPLECLSSLESEDLYGKVGCCKVGDLHTFISRLEKGSIDLFPDYQRSYVWDPKRALRLIVTILCNRFMPPLVLHEVEKGRYDVVDGKQRLTSLLAWYMNREGAVLPKDASVRKKMEAELPKLKVLSKLEDSYAPLNGLAFDDLDEDRKLAYENYAINYMVIPYDTPKKDVFEVYSRFFGGGDINSGGQNLSHQQIRRAVYHGPYMKMIDQLRESCLDFQEIRLPQVVRGSKPYELCKKDSEGELILRALAFRRNGHEFKPSIKQFLNQSLEDWNSTKDKSSSRGAGKTMEFKQEFELVMRIAREVFGTRAFWKKTTARTTGNVSNAMWDAKYAAIAELLDTYKEAEFIRAKEKLVKTYISNIQTGFFASDDEVTSRTKFLKRKDELKRIFSEVLEAGTLNRDTKRLFSSKLKWELYEQQGGVCGICNQTMDKERLGEEGYVHIDHIVPYSLGGRTVPENGQLTHRACNLSKGASI